MVNIIGLGYIGLPTALMLAAHGVSVVGTDYSEQVVAQLRAKQLTFEEAGLEALFAKAVDAGISFTTAYQETDTYIIAVATPYEEENKKVDASYVVAAIKQVLQVCPKGAVIIIESTVSPGTIDRYVRPLLAAQGLVAGEDIHLVHAPERIIPGNMLYELIHNSRTIGADSAEIAQRVRDLYASFCKGEIVLTDIRTAEMTKVIENTFRAVNIAFANELAKLCSEEGMDVYEIIRICNMHPRVNILSPGPGVGGHCIPVDPWFLVGDYKEKTPLIAQAMQVNQSMPDFVFRRICAVMQAQGIADFSRVGLYGLTYKANVDDVRESPTLQLLARHSEAFAVFDPMVSRDIVENQYHDFEAFLEKTDLIVIMVDHKHLKKHMNSLDAKAVLDLRCVYNGENVYHL
ncbi:MAG: nucleotide sugar dehydrogenase [Oscillospiraceae bacterium]|jgi:UDP-N-acetyl-D-mannosaminuronic acid dehydrogenase|nr:nucleotide sugar dehydrogenase [Oscillospiraceae bacterium]